MERLADALYPPRPGKVNGRKVGQAEYRNRFWAYIHDSIQSRTQRDIVISTLVDVGSRIDSLDAVTNKGLHADLNTGETQRLLMAMLTLIYDVLTLAPPPLKTPDAPYKESPKEFFDRMLQ